MKSIDNFDWKGYSRSYVTQAFMTKIFYLWSGRNAWNLSWASRYPGINAFHLSLYEAKKEIEKRRIQGSTWTICELPAIALVSDHITLVMAEINTDSPFSKYTFSLGESILLKKISEQLAPKTKNSVVQFTTATVLEPAVLPFIRFNSCSYGGKYCLGWKKEGNTVNLQYTYELILKTSQIVQKKL